MWRCRVVLDLDMYPVPVSVVFILIRLGLLCYMHNDSIRAIVLQYRYGTSHAPRTFGLFFLFLFSLSLLTSSFFLLAPFSRNEWRSRSDRRESARLGLWMYVWAFVSLHQLPPLLFFHFFLPSGSALFVDYRVSGMCVCIIHTLTTACMSLSLLSLSHHHLHHKAKPVGIRLRQKHPRRARRRRRRRRWVRRGHGACVRAVHSAPVWMMNH